MKPPVSTFPALDALGEIGHAFVERVPGIDVAADRETALARLEAIHAEVARDLHGGVRFVTARQVHGNGVAVVDGGTPAPVEGVDGLVTNDPKACLGIYVADCCAVYLADPVRKAIGLVHSGRKGTELGIAAAAVGKMREAFGSDPRDLVVQLSPCIRPPHYETDFAEEIVRQCRQAGVENVHDCGSCTASDATRYYSYRREKGRTGRMLALIVLRA